MRSKDHSFSHLSKSIHTRVSRFADQSTECVGFENREESAESFTVVSDHMHYLSTSVEIPEWLQTCLFYFLCFQIIVVGLMPQLDEFWLDASFRSFTNLLGIIALMQTPEHGSVVFIAILSVDVALIILEILVSAITRMLYSRSGHVHPALCYLSRLMSLLMSTLFLMTSAAFCAGFIGHTFMKGVPRAELGLAIVVLVVITMSFLRAMWLLTFTHYTVSYGEQLFLCQKGDTVMRVYLSLFIEVFVACVLKEDRFFSIIVPWVVVITSFVNFWIDLLRAPWGRIDDYKMVVTAWASAWGSALVMAFDRTNKDYTSPDIDFWLAVGWLVLCIMIVPSICDLVIKKALKRLDDPDFVTKTRSVATALRDLRIGFRMGHQGTMECIHIRGLFERFPNDVDLLFFCSRIALSLSQCPYTVEELERSLSADHSFSPVKAHFDKSLVRIIAPSDPKEVEKYNRQVIQLHTAFIHLFDDARSLYDVIIDEMSAIFSKVMRSYTHHYHSALRALYGFLERYPFSPDGDFFLEIFSVLYPNTSEMQQMSKWQMNKPDYVRQHLSYFPRQLPGVVNSPELFRSYQPEYRVRRKNMPTIPPSLRVVEKTRKTTGPYGSIVTRWYVLLLLFLMTVFPLVSMGLMIAQNNRFETRAEQLVQGWSLTWLLTRSETFLYPLLFFETSDPFWAGSQAMRNQYMKDYSANVTELRAGITKFGYGIGGSLENIDMDLLGKISEFMSSPADFGTLQGDSLSITQTFLMTTFIGDDIMTEDSGMVPENMTMEMKLNLMNMVSGEIIHITQAMQNFLTSAASATSDNEYTSTIAFLVISCCLIVLTYIVLVVLLLGASSKFDVFFKTLRDTSKAAVASMRQFIRLCQSVLGSTRRRGRGNRYKKGFINFAFLSIGCNLIIALVMIVLCVLEYLSVLCRIKQVNRLTQLYSTYTTGYNNLSTTLREAFLKKFADKDPLEVYTNVAELFDWYQKGMWAHYNQGNAFCRLCSTVDVYHLYSGAGLTYEKLVFNYMVLMRLYVLPSGEVDESRESIFVQTLQIWYFQIVSALTTFAERFTETCASFYDRTRNLEIVFAVLYLVFALLFIVCFVYCAYILDLPFKHMVQLFTRFPDSVLSNDSLMILRQNNWSFKSSGFIFDSAMYDELINRIPDAIIIIDKTCVIMTHNLAAQRLVNVEDAVGKRLFDQLLMTLTTLQEKDDDKMNEEEPAEPERLEALINDYMSDDRSSILVTKLMGVVDTQKFWFSLTILPIFPEANDLLMSQNQTAERFAVVFRDIGDEIRQQNLVAEETRKHLQIVHQILPTEIATRLLKEQRSISMTVETVAISFCDIVQFTPWCGSQPAENVVTALNYMFNLFDERCSRYETVTKIKCIGDCYMSAAGIFSNAVGPAVFGVEMVHFCLDLIDAIEIVNEKLGTKLMVRIGVALGGPISAGVMGIHKPVFDIWGEAVNDAQNLESGGCPMKVHINQELRDFLNAPDVHIEPKGDGTYFCTRELVEQVKEEEEDGEQSNE